MRRRFSGILAIHIVLAACIFSLNHWTALIKNRGDYSPFAVLSGTSSLVFDETHAYAPPARRFMTTGVVPAEVDDYELRNWKAAVPFVPPVILGTVGRLLGSLEWSFIFADVLFPPFCLYLFFIATKGMIKTTILRFLLAWTVLLIPFGPRNFLWLGYDAFAAPPDFSRTPQPEISFPLVILGTLLVARALYLRTVSSNLIAGIVSALIVYSYYFYTVAWGIVLAMMLLLAVVWKSWDLLRRTAGILAIMSLGALPFVIATLRGKAEGGQTNLLVRMGAFTHAAHFGSLLALAVGLIAVWRFGKNSIDGTVEQIRFVMFTLLLLAGIAGLNFQVVSGYDAQHTHYWNRLILPIGFFLAGCRFFAALEKIRSPYLRAAAVIVLAGILANAGARQWYVGNRAAEAQKASRPEIEILTWVRMNRPPESVIGSLDPVVILLTPALTNDYNYVPTGLRSLASTDEIVDRYYDLAALAGFTTDEVKDIAIRQDHFQQKSILTEILGYQGTANTFAAGFAQHRATHTQRRLDYLLVPASMHISQRLIVRFPAAKVIHANSQYEVIAL